MEEQKKSMDSIEPMNINADSDIPGNISTDEAPSPESLLEKTMAELDENKDKYVRLMAEFDNFKKRTYREKTELFQTAGKDVIYSLLEVLDDMDRAEKQHEAGGEDAHLSEGTKLIFGKFRKILQGKGLTAMQSIGQPLNVELHEAISSIPAGEGKEDIIINELEKGYFLNDKIIRVAKVVVGK